MPTKYWLLIVPLLLAGCTKRSRPELFVTAQTLFVQGQYHACLNVLDNLHKVEDYEGEAELRSFCEKGVQLTVRAQLAGEIRNLASLPPSPLRGTFPVRNKLVSLRAPKGWRKELKNIPENCCEIIRLTPDLGKTESFFDISSKKIENSDRPFRVLDFVPDDEFRDAEVVNLGGRKWVRVHRHCGGRPTTTYLAVIDSNIVSVNLAANDQKVFEIRRQDFSKILGSIKIVR